MRRSKGIGWFICCAALFSLTLHCTPLKKAERKRYQYTQLHLGVQVRIVLFTEKESNGIRAAKAAFDHIAELEDVFSDYRPNSEIRRLVRTERYTPVQVSPPLFELLGYAQALASKTNGAFDVTSGPLSLLWRKARKSERLPERDSLLQALDRVGHRYVQLDEQRQSVQLQVSGMQLDVGGIAKGYILDKALEILTDQGIESAMIEAGGDIVVSGPPPNRKGWNINIVNAPDSVDIARQAAEFSHAAIATSGDTEQFVEIDGTRYSHVFDPRTGLALTYRRMATVIAPKGWMADGYATASTVMTPEELAGFIGRHPEIEVFVRSSE